MKIVANEFALPMGMNTECHANHFVTLEKGHVFLVCFLGSREGNDDVRIAGVHRSPNGAWSSPEYITEEDGLPHWNPVLLKRHDGAVMLFYKVGKPISDWKTRYMLSFDGCKTWTKSRELVPGDESGGRGPVRNKAIYLRNGSILAPASTERGEWKCFFDRSDDEGKTWLRSRELCVPAGTLDGYSSKKGKGIIQPTVWESAEGVHALMRSSEGAIYRTDSRDGMSWCNPYRTEIPNNNSGIDLDVLPDGRLILCCNPVGGNWGARSPISLFASTDNGHSFSLLTHLTTMPGEYSYPAVQYADGMLHVTYTWNRRTIQYFCLENL